jgi:signal transduction histidine kinase
LTGIRGAAYVLKKNYAPVLDQKGRDMLKTIDDCVQYSDKIVKDLMEYSSEIALDKIKLSSRQAVTIALSKFIIPSNVHVFNNTSEDHLLLADPEKIERVITNLVVNAFDAMPNGGTLTITSKKHSRSIELDFEDTGLGMPRAVLEKLWTPFFTTKASVLVFGQPVYDIDKGNSRYAKPLPLSLNILIRSSPFYNIDYVDYQSNRCYAHNC